MATHVVDNILSMPRCAKVEPASDWAEQLTIPVRFSGGTSEAVRSGLVTKAARIEINNSLATLVMVYTMRPTPTDMHTVCRRLVEKYPKLKDSSPNGYVSIHLYHLTSTFPSITCPIGVCYLHCTCMAWCVAIKLMIIFLSPIMSFVTEFLEGDVTH